jgi:hypothetical protein
MDMVKPTALSKYFLNNERRAIIWGRVLWPTFYSYVIHYGKEFKYPQNIICYIKYNNLRPLPNKPVGRLLEIVIQRHHVFLWEEWVLEVESKVAKTSY